MAPAYDEKETAYRSGYTHGAWDLIEALEWRLSVEDGKRLRDWFNELQVWKNEHLQGERKTPPPRKLLRRLLGEKC